jgi:nucleotide-binding universal stress UspA family protein
MYRKILVPLNGSKLGESVLPYVRCLAEALKVPVHLLSVKEQEKMDGPSESLRGLDYLNNVASSFLGSLTVRCLVEIGKPAEVIVNIAAQDSGTLIVMATRNRSGIQRWLSESVAHTVLYAARNPLLLVRATRERQPSDSVELKTIMALLDGSPIAEKVLPQVLEIGKALKSEVVLVRTYSLPRGSHAFAKRFYVPYTDQLAENAKEEARNYIRGKVRELQAEGIDKASCVLVERDSGAEIIDLSRKTSGNMLAVYMHRSSTMVRLAVGSITERVVRHWANPVLIVRSAAFAWCLPLLSLCDVGGTWFSL